VGQSPLFVGSKGKFRLRAVLDFDILYLAPSDDLLGESLQPMTQCYGATG
jgi:hypothetical protein